MLKTSQKRIDLFSDTQTLPTPEMVAAMLAAEVGDEQRGTDPTVKRLEARVAELLGHEAAVFLPSGTMCNAIAVRLHIRPGGDEIILDEVCAPGGVRGGRSCSDFGCVDALLAHVKRDLRRISARGRHPAAGTVTHRGRDSSSSSSRPIWVVVGHGHSTASERCWPWLAGTRSEPTSTARGS